MSYDTEHALLEYGPTPTLQILNAKKKTATRPETFEPSQKCVQGVCLDTEHATLELSQTKPLPQKTHVKYPCLVAWAGSGGGYQCPYQSMLLAPAGLTALPQTGGSQLSS